MTASMKSASTAADRQFVKDQEPMVHSSVTKEAIHPQYKQMQMAVESIADPCHFSAIKDFYGLK